MKIRLVEVELFNADGRKDGRQSDRQTDRHDEASNHFSQLNESA